MVTKLRLDNFFTRFFEKKKEKKTKKLTRQRIKKEDHWKKPRLGVIAKKIAIKIKKPSFIIFLLSIPYIVLFFIYHNKILFTPDFGQSDAYHFNFSLKYFLSENLKKGMIPFWTEKLQGGFPLISEGQIGFFFLPNLILLKFLPFRLAYPTLLFSSLYFFSLGFYLLLREVGITSILAFFLSFIAAFNGSISFRFVHLNLIQAFSLAPWLFWLLIKFLKKPRKNLVFFSSLAICQMILAGHFQTVFITLFALSLWYLINIYSRYLKNRRKLIGFSLIFLLIVVSGFFLAFFQLLPTYVLSLNSSRSLQLDFSTSTSFPLTYRHLVSFFSLYPFGNPRFGQYPAYSENWGVFWENTPYLGPVFFILLFYSIIIVKPKRLWGKVRVYFYLFLFFLFLALGRNSPLYFLFNFPPFNFFRTPSKYLLMAVFFLIMGSAFIFNYSLKKTRLISRIIFIFFLVINVVHLIKVVFNYHLFVNSKKLLQAPVLVEDISERYFSYGQIFQWNKFFLKDGWHNEKTVNAYLFFKNYLYPNSNLLFNKQVYDINTGGLKLKRPEYLKSLILSELEKQKLTKKKSNLPSLFRLLGIKYLIVDFSLSDDNFKLLRKTTWKKQKIFLYQLKDFKSHVFYIPDKLIKVDYLQEVNDYFKKGRVWEKVSLVEGLKKSPIKNNKQYQIFYFADSETEVNFDGVFGGKTFLVIKKNIFPEWQVYIDGKKTNYSAVNLVHFGFFVPKGYHQISVKYENNSFKTGLVISLAYFIAFILILRGLKIG